MSYPSTEAKGVLAELSMIIILCYNFLSRANQKYHLKVKFYLYEKKKEKKKNHQSASFYLPFSWMCYLKNNTKRKTLQADDFYVEVYYMTENDVDLLNAV